MYFGYTRDNYYKSIAHEIKEELCVEMIKSSVLEIRRKHPRKGGKKLYYLLRDMSKSLHIGRDNFFDILRISDMLVKQKNKAHGRRIHIIGFMCIRMN
jgi:hypothetical protein